MSHQIVLRTVTVITPAASAQGWPCRLAARHQLGRFTALSSFCNTSPVTNSTSVSVHGHPTSHQYHRGGLNPARSSLVDRCSASLSSPSASLPVHTTQTRQNSDNAAGQACDTFFGDFSVAARSGAPVRRRSNGSEAESNEFVLSLKCQLSHCNR